jgi:hypothetical protein
MSDTLLQLLKLSADRFVGFDKVRELFTKFSNPFEASYEENEPTLQLQLIHPHCSDELTSKFKTD